MCLRCYLLVSRITVALPLINIYIFMLNQSWFVNVQRFNKLSRYIIQQKEAIELVSSHDCILVMAIAQRTHMYRCQSWQQVPLRAVNLCCTDAWKIQELLYPKSYSARALGELATHTFPLRLIPVVPSHTFCFCRCVSFPTSQNHCVCLSQKKPASASLWKTPPLEAPPPPDPGTRATPSAFVASSPSHRRCAPPPTLEAARHPRHLWLSVGAGLVRV
jgi:hypothetical protein